MRVNGKDVPLEAPVTLLEFLAAQGYDPARVAVELGGTIIPRARFGEQMLADGDTIEIVHFVGGG